MPLSFKDVAEILKIVDASDCEEVILEVEGTRLVVRKGQIAGLGGGVASTSSVGASTTAAPASAEQPAPAQSTEGTSDAATVNIDDGLVAVRSPMVGTTYRRPAPDEPPFVGGRNTGRKRDATLSYRGHETLYDHRGAERRRHRSHLCG